VHLEAEAVLLILAQCEAGQNEWVSSDVVDIEIGQTPDLERRRRVQALTSHAHRSIAVERREAERAQQLESLGVAAYDALHLACAESARVDVFLTTDDRLLRRSAALREQIGVRVENPLGWLREVG